MSTGDAWAPLSLYAIGVGLDDAIGNVEARCLAAKTELDPRCVKRDVFTFLSGEKNASNDANARVSFWGMTHETTQADLVAVAGSWPLLLDGLDACAQAQISVKALMNWRRYAKKYYWLPNYSLTVLLFLWITAEVGE